MKNPSNQLNLPGLRERKQRSGKTFYYLQLLGASRREVPLGQDFKQAVRKRREILIDHHVQSICTVNTAEILKLYAVVELPNRDDIRAIGAVPSRLPIGGLLVSSSLVSRQMSADRSALSESHWPSLP